MRVGARVGVGVGARVPVGGGARVGARVWVRGVGQRLGPLLQLALLLDHSHPAHEGDLARVGVRVRVRVRVRVGVRVGVGVRVAVRVRVRVKG